MVTRWIDLTGQVFGRLTVIKRVASTHGNSRFLCRCECGNEKEVSAYYLKDGQIRSCGCYSKEWRTKHGKHKSTEYTIWAGILQRCNNPKDRGYKHYGGRGIKVCERWSTGFENFYEDMGPRPSKNHSIDRIDVNGNYEPSNCRWATKEIQSINTRIKSTNRTGYKGVTFDKSKGKFRARIVVSGKEIHIGTYDTVKEAAEARKEAELKYRSS